MQLGRPKLAKPLQLDLEKTSSVKTSVVIDSQYNPENICVQIIQLEGPFPSCVFQPTDVLELQNEGKSDTYLTFTEEKYANAKIKISAEIKNQKLELEASVICDSIIQSNKAVKYSVNELEQTLSKEATRLQRMQGPNDRTPEGRRKNEQQKKRVDFLSDLKNLYQTINKQTKIHYNVFVPYDKNKYILYMTQAPTGEYAEAERSANEKFDDPTKRVPKKPSKKK